MVGAVHEASFFQKQIERCSLLAEQASSQSEQEFWVRSVLGGDPGGQKRETPSGKAVTLERPNS